MTIKNIAFSGFMAAIMLNATAANAADPIAIASKTLVTKTAESLQANIDLKQDALKTSEAGRVVIDENDNISVNLSGYATSQDVTGAISAKFEGEGGVDAKITSLETRADGVDTVLGEIPEAGWTVDGRQQDTVSKAIVALNAKTASSADVSAVMEKVNGGAETAGTIAYDIAQALTSAKGYTDELASGAVKTNTEAIADLKSADTGLDERIDAIEGAGYQDSTQVGSAIDAKINALDLANTYDAKGAAAAAQNAAIADAAGKYATTSALEGVSAVANAADALSKTNQGEINTLKTAGYQTAEQVSDKITAEAVTSVATGSTNGTISVDGNDVPVYGLGSAAYTSADAYEEAGAAAAVQTAIDGAKYVSGKDVAAGTYLITTDGAGTYTWTSVKIVNE